jgi:hypothetical protein
MICMIRIIGIGVSRRAKQHAQGREAGQAKFSVCKIATAVQGYIAVSVIVSSYIVCF